MNKSEQINELATSLAKAQGEIKAALKDSSNPFFKSKYADLSSVWEACRSALSKNGLSVTQLPFSVEGSFVGIETTLLHSSGQFISSSLTVPVTKYDAQGIGSAITYARRYALAAVVGVVADEDDDGEGAVGRKKETKEPEPDKDGKAKLEACDSLDMLQDVWASLTQEQRFSCAKVKDQMKQKLTKAA